MGPDAVSAPAPVARVPLDRAEAAVAALDGAHPGLATGLPAWLRGGLGPPGWSLAWGPAEPVRAAEPVQPGEAGAAVGRGAAVGAWGPEDVPPLLAAALVASIAAWVAVDVVVLDGGACLRGRWSLGAGVAGALVLGADSGGAACVEAGLVPAAEVVADVVRRLPAVAVPTCAGGEPGVVAASDLLAMSVLDASGSRQLLGDVERSRGAAAADALHRCATARLRIDVDVRSGSATRFASWLAGAGWSRLDPGHFAGEVVVVPVDRGDVARVLAPTLRAVALDRPAPSAGPVRTGGCR